MRKSGWGSIGDWRGTSRIISVSQHAHTHDAPSQCKLTTYLFDSNGQRNILCALVFTLPFQPPIHLLNTPTTIHSHEPHFSRHILSSHTLSRHTLPSHALMTHPHDTSPNTSSHDTFSHSSGSDDFGKRHAFYFLPWHFEFLCRYRPLPETPFRALSQQVDPPPSLNAD